MSITHSASGSGFWSYIRATTGQLADFDRRHAHLASGADDARVELRQFHERRGFWAAGRPEFDGVDARGFKLDELHFATHAKHDSDGFDWRGHDRFGHNRDGWNQRGFDRDGTHRNGTLRDDAGLDADGYGEDGFASGATHPWVLLWGQDCDRRGFTRDGNDVNGRNRFGYYQGRKSASIWWVSDEARSHYLPQGWSLDEPRTSFPYTRRNVRPDDIYFECVHGSRQAGSPPHDGASRLSLHWRAQECFVLGQRLADDRKGGVHTPHLDVFTARWIEALESLRGEAITEMPFQHLSHARKDQQMMALALRAGLGYAEPTRRELIELGYEKVVRHYAPTLKWGKRSTLGSAA